MQDVLRAAQQAQQEMRRRQQVVLQQLQAEEELRAQRARQYRSAQVCVRCPHPSLAPLLVS
jgi:hypothetical protein